MSSVAMGHYGDRQSDRQKRNGEKGLRWEGGAGTVQGLIDDGVSPPHAEMRYLLSRITVIMGRLYDRFSRPYLTSDSIVRYRKAGGTWFYLKTEFPVDGTYTHPADWSE
jgi:hypothetical protein